MSTEKAVAVKEKDISKLVLERIAILEASGELSLPKDYNAANALKGAWLHLQDTIDKNGKSAIEVCTDLSISRALSKMVTNGLSVVKNQCYLVVYGDQLTCQDSYFGNYARAKRECGVIDAIGQVVYEGDKDGFKYETDLRTNNIKILAHPQNIDNIDNNKIAGAYATIFFSDGRKKTTVMSMAQIRENWLFGHAKGNSLAHKRTPDQMAIRTVLNRALKLELNSSDDSHLVNINQRKEENTDVETIDMEATVVEEEAKTNSVKEGAENESTDKDDTPEF